MALRRAALVLQRAAALRFADPRVQGLCHSLVLFAHLTGELTGKRLREHLTPLLGLRPKQISAGRITYELRRLRLHGLIERLPKSYRYRITPMGLRVALFYTRLYNRVLRTGLSLTDPKAACSQLPLSKSIRAAQKALDSWCDQARLAA